MLAHCALVGDRGVIVARANTYAPGDGSGGSAAVQRVPVTTQAWSSAARVTGHEAAEASAVDISEAEVLVAGGRGLGIRLSAGVFGLGSWLSGLVCSARESG